MGSIKRYDTYYEKINWGEDQSRAVELARKPEEEQKFIKKGINPAHWSDN